MGRLAALRGSRFHNRRARAGSRGRALRVIRGSVPAGGLMMESRALRADIRAHFVAKKFPLQSKNDAPGFATPHALSNPGVYSESLIIKIAPTECMRCDK